MRYGRLICGLAIAGVLGVCVTPAPAAAPKQSRSAVEVFGKDRTPGVPPDGPAALYSPPPKLAMTTNHDRLFRAPYNLVSGSERYIGGEYQFRQPTNDTPNAGIIHDKAHWLTQLEVRDTSARVAKGTIDAVSYGFGLAQADTALKAPVVGMDAPGNVFIQNARYWKGRKAAPRQDRLVITATNIKHVTIDPAAARLSCKAKIEIHSDGPLTVELRGCGRSVRA